MYKSNIYQPAYHSKKTFMVYNLNLVRFLYIKWFKGYTGLNTKPFYFSCNMIQKKIKLLNFKCK